MRSNQPLDVAQLQERWLPTFAALNNLADVEVLFGKPALEEKIDPGLLRIGRFGGVQWGVPWTAGARWPSWTLEGIVVVTAIRTPSRIRTYRDVTRELPAWSWCDVMYCDAGGQRSLGGG